MARVKYSVEFQLKANPELIYTYVATASGLSTWFADNVNINSDVFSFEWGDVIEKARLLKSKHGKMAKFKWLGRDQDEFLTFDIEQDELTREVALIVSDYEEEDEVDDARLMWESSIDQLRQTIGA